MSSAWVGVIGSLGGVSVGALASSLLERARWRRTERTRWHDHRLALYVRFLEATKRLHDAINDFAAVPEADRFRALKEVGGVNAELVPIQSEIELLAGAEVRRTVGLVNFGQIRMLEIAARDPRDVRGDELSERLRAYRAGREEFTAAARSEIGLDTLNEPSLAAATAGLSSEYARYLASGHIRDT